MNKIVFKISKNNLSAALYSKDIKEDLNNTNVIDTKEIYFSTLYIKENLELVSSFLNVIILKQNIHKVTIKDYDIIFPVLDIISLIPSIKELYIKPDKVLTYEMFLKILDNEYLTYINAYDIPKYLLERLDLTKQIDIDLRSEILFTSNFMESNKLNTYSDIYYKKSIIIDKDFLDTDTNDFLTFLNINKYLKQIEFSYFSNDLFELITNELLRLDIHNIKIIFNEQTLDIKRIYKPINDFKTKHEKSLKERNIIFKINYSDEYKKNNIFKQLNLNIIKGSLITIILAVILMIGINTYRNLNDNKQSDLIENDIKNIINDMTSTTTTTKNNDIEYIEPNSDDMEIINSTTTSIYDIKYEMVFEKLLAINKDTVGWLTVNHTNIDYPVVLYKNNDYYLKKDYYQNNNRHGWIFMDYRNSIEHLGRNTIIYGHNLANQKMFGTLRYALNSSWYTKSSNQIITFNTLYTNMKWQIFSIYKVPVTNDYLTTDFRNNDEYLEFLNMIKSRSIYDFKQELTIDDKILTLSTCSNGHDQRLVVHAKLINEN